MFPAAKWSPKSPDKGVLELKPTTCEEKFDAIFKGKSPKIDPHPASTVVLDDWEDDIDNSFGGVDNVDGDEFKPVMSPQKPSLAVKVKAPKLDPAPTSTVILDDDWEDACDNDGVDDDLPDLGLPSLASRLKASTFKSDAISTDDHVQSERQG